MAAILPDNRGAMTARPRLFFLLLLAAFSARSLASFGFFFFRDNFSTHYPIKVLSAAAFRAGEIPWWNFADGGGQPLAGNPNTLTFYPDNVLYLVLPAHVAFNLHFLLHLIARLVRDARADALDDSAAWMWVLTGVAMSALSFYNLITAIALIPLALLGAERRNAVQLGVAFGLLALAGEPVTIVATAIAVADSLRPSAPPRETVPFAIADRRQSSRPATHRLLRDRGEVERAHGYSAQTVLNASFDPRRLLEILIGPFIQIDAPHLFPSLILGLIVDPRASFRRSRYTVDRRGRCSSSPSAHSIRSCGWLVESVSALRIGRFPEKFAHASCAPRSSSSPRSTCANRRRRASGRSSRSCRC